MLLVQVSSVLYNFCDLHLVFALEPHEFPLVKSDFREEAAGVSLYQQSQ